MIDLSKRYGIDDQCKDHTDDHRQEAGKHTWRGDVAPVAGFHHGTCNSLSGSQAHTGQIRTADRKGGIDVPVTPFVIKPDGSGLRTDCRDHLFQDRAKRIL